MHLRETGGSQHIVDLVCGPANLFDSLSVAAPKTPFLHEPIAITPGPAAFQIMAVSHGENVSGLLDPPIAPPVLVECGQIVDVEEEPPAWIE